MKEQPRQETGWSKSKEVLPKCEAWAETKTRKKPLSLAGGIRARCKCSSAVLCIQPVYAHEEDVRQSMLGLKLEVTPQHAIPSQPHFKPCTSQDTPALRGETEALSSPTKHQLISKRSIEMHTRSICHQRNSPGSLCTVTVAGVIVWQMTAGHKQPKDTLVMCYVCSLTPGDPRVQTDVHVEDGHANSSKLSDMIQVVSEPVLTSWNCFAGDGLWKKNNL